MRDDHGTAGYNPALEPLLTVSGTCDVLRVIRQTVYRLVRRGELHPSRVGERLRFGTRRQTISGAEAET